MRILYDNFWDDYVLGADQEDTSYPAGNTQDIRLAKTWRTITASASTIYIGAATGQTLTCNCAAVINHNFTSGMSSGVAIQAATVDTFIPTGFSNAFTYRADILIKFFSSSQTYHNWRFLFNVTDNPDGYYEIGRFFLGTYLQVDPSSLVEFPENHFRSDRQVFSVTNQIYSDEGIGHKEYRYSFENTNNTMKAAMQTMWETVGRHKPILFMNYDTAYTEIPPVYCVIGEDMTFTHLKHDYWKYDLVLREVD